ncbi:MAG: sugar phosphate isomerase/epimerase, partial [Oligosphaeraceae bacterium]|nr:sugar phosphate isomerase/epimerase [Oligosphaeraceae bacterium]
GLGFWFETGQETPIVLLRVIEEIGDDNLGINLDPANLLMYGKGNPLDSLEVFGKYVRNLHVKDGMTPTDGRKLGREVQVGKGMVNFPRLVQRLREIGFDGEFIIEREIAEGEEQQRDILETVANLQQWWEE